MSRMQDIMQFRELGQTLSKSGLKTTLPSYLKAMLVWTAGVASASMILTGFFGIAFRIPAQTITFFEASAGLISVGITFSVFYIYPRIRVDVRKNEVEQELPYLISHMATMAVSGLTPEQIFSSLAEVPRRAIADEARRIARDFEFLGIDLYSALEAARDRAISKPFAELIDGFLTTAKSGGSLQSYLLSMHKSVISEKRVENKKTTDKLGMLAETYITLLIIFPLLSIIMGSIMGLIMPFIGPFSIQFALTLIAYVVTPMLAVIMLVVFSVVFPSRR